MLLPWMWLRKRKLEPLLKNYPLYDPPHKKEERLLPREQAQENFDYFMRVREERAAHFTKWVKDEFAVKIEATVEGVEALSQWMFRYGGLLLFSRTAEKSYFSYDPAWIGESAGCNVLFDAGTTFGEFIIANCPKLTWEMDPISAVRPNAARRLKREFGSSFWRPLIIGFDNPNWRVNPLHQFWMYPCALADIATISGRWNFRDHLGRRSTQHLSTSLTLLYTNTLREYQAGDPTTLYGSTGIPADLEDEDD